MSFWGSHPAAWQLSCSLTYSHISTNHSQRNGELYLLVVVIWKYFWLHMAQQIYKLLINLNQIVHYWNNPYCRTVCGYCQTTTKFKFYLNRERFKILKKETSEPELYLDESFLAALIQMQWRLWGFFIKYLEPFSIQIKFEFSCSLTVSTHTLFYNMDYFSNEQFDSD